MIMLLLVLSQRNRPLMRYDSKHQGVNLSERQVVAIGVDGNVVDLVQRSG
jgi:hypothetical protein